MTKKIDHTWDSVTLVLIGGGEVELVIRSDVYDEVWDEIRVCFAKNDIWFCANWDNCGVSYYGRSLDFIDFKKIIGISS